MVCNKSRKSTFLDISKKSTFLDIQKKSTFLDSKSLLFWILPKIKSLLFWTPKSLLFWTVLECGIQKVYFFGCNQCIGWTRTLFREMVKFSNFPKISLPSDSASDIIPMLKFWVACMLSVRRYGRKHVTDIDQFVYGKTPSKSKIFQNWRFLRILHGIWLDGVFFLPIILIHTRIISVLKL